jgi:hypothetical protein
MRAKFRGEKGQSMAMFHGSCKRGEYAAVNGEAAAEGKAFLVSKVWQINHTQSTLVFCRIALCNVLNTVQIQRSGGGHVM